MLLRASAEHGEIDPHIVHRVLGVTTEEENQSQHFARMLSLVNILGYLGNMKELYTVEMARR